MLAVCPAVDQPGVGESLEPVLEDVAGDSEIALEMIEAMYAHHQFADHEQRPSLPDKPERAGNAAFLADISAVQRHGESVRE